MSFQAERQPLEGAGIQRADHPQTTAEPATLPPGKRPAERGSLRVEEPEFRGGGVRNLVGKETHPVSFWYSNRTTE